MRFFIRLTIAVIILIAAAACGGASLPDGDGLVAHSRQVWAGDWHAVWQIEWVGAPVGSPLVAEIWHTADGQLRIETLEAPVAALSGLTLVDDGVTVWLYDLRQDQVESGSNEQLRIPLASDALEAIDWLLLEMDGVTVNVTGRDALESGPATRLEVILPAGDRAVLWVHDETGLPAHVELRSAIWGEATFIARNINATAHQQPALFAFPRP